MTEGKRPMLNGFVNRICNVGIEVEGGWDIPVAGYDIIRDGSVKFEPPDQQLRRQAVFSTDPRTGAPMVTFVNREGEPIPDQLAMHGVKPYPRYAIGEIVSPKEPLLTPSTFPAWMRHCYPQHVNSSCGLHVHMSFYHKLNYSRLLTADYTTAMVSSLKEWATKEGLPAEHPLWNRLNTPNHPHCAHKFLGDRQVLIRKKDYNSRGTDYSRYTFINYCEAQHHTVECRGLSMFEDVEQAIRAVTTVIDVTNRFLSKIRSRERSAKVQVNERPAVFQEFGTVIR